MDMGIGPDRATREAAPASVEKVSDHVWSMSFGNNAARIFEIAHADFTGGGLGEILTYVQMNAVGGRWVNMARP